jgi:hypothetical protein
LTDIATTLDCNAIDEWAVQLKGSLNSDPVRHFSQGKCRIKAAVSATYNDPFKRLESLSTAFYYADLNHQRIARAEGGNILLELCLLDLLYHFIFHNPVLLSPSPHVSRLRCLPCGAI